MKRSGIRAFIAIAGVLAALSFTQASHAGTATKANNTTNLDLGGSWVGGTAPAASDIGWWDSTVTGANSASFSTTGTRDWNGIQITNPGGAVTINNASDRYLRVGAGGVDMSSATQDLTINYFDTNANNTWNVATARTLTIGTYYKDAGTVSLAGGGTITEKTAGGAAGAIHLGGNNSGFTGSFTDAATSYAAYFDAATAGSARAAGTFNGTWLALNANANSTYAFGAMTGSANVYNSYNVTSTLQVGALNTNTTYSGVIGTGGGSGTVALIKQGTGTLTLSNGNTYTGGTTVNDGILSLTYNSGANGTIKNALTINSGAEVQQNGAGWCLGYDVSANYVTSITINGGTLNFVQNTGGTDASTINMTAGTIKGGAFDWYTSSNGQTFTLTTAASAASSVISSGLNLRLGSSGTASFNVADGAATDDLLISGVISAGQPNQTVIKTGAGQLTLTANNTYSGATIINQGVLSLSGAGGYISNSATITVGNGATLALSGANNKLGSGVGTWNINGTLAVTDTTAHTLYASTITLNGGTMTSTAGNSTYGSFFAGANRAITANGTGNTISAVNVGIGNGVTLTLNTPLASDTLTASTAFINGGGGTTGGLAKSGAGTVILSGNNTYTGATTVSGGTLQVNAGGAINNGASGIGIGGSSGATLTIAGGAVTSTATNSTWGFTIGNTASGSGALTITSGTLTASAVGMVGASGATATFNQTGGSVSLSSQQNWGNAVGGGLAQITLSGGTLTHSAGQNFYLAPWSPATMTISGTAITSIGNLYLGYSGTQTATLYLEDGSTLSVAGTLYAGNGNGTAIWNQTGGTVTVGSQVNWGNGSDVGGGSGNNAIQSTFSVSGGSFTQTAGIFYLGPFSPTTMTIANIGLVTLQTLNFGYSGSQASTVNLDGGTLKVNNMTYGGGTSVDTISFNGGKLQAGAGFTMPPSTNVKTVVNAGGAVIDTIGNTLTITSALTAGTGSGGLTKYGTGTLTLSGANTYTGTTTANSGYMSLNSASGTSIPGDLTLNNAWIYVGNANNQFGANSVIRFSTTNSGGYYNVLELDGYNQTVAGIAGGRNDGNGGFVENGQNRTSIGPVTFTINTVNPGDSFTYTGVIRDQAGGAFSLVKSGPGTQVLSGVNQFTGATTVNGGTLKATTAMSTASLTVGSGGIFEAGGVDNVTNQKPWTIAGTVFVDNGYSQTLGNVALNGGTLTGTGTGDAAGYGHYTIPVNSFSITSTGNSTINAPGGLTLQNSNGALTINVVNPGDTLTVSSAISHAPGSSNVGLTKSGNGILNLTAGNSYSGGTTVTGGTLRVSNASGSGTGTGPVTVNSGGTLGGTGFIGGPVIVNGTGIVAPGASIGRLTLNGNFTLAGGSLDIELDGTAGAGLPGGNDVLGVYGLINLSGGNLDLLLNANPGEGNKFLIVDNLGGGSVASIFPGLGEGGWLTAPFEGRDYRFQITYQGGTGNDVVLTSEVPEPATLALLGLAVTGLGGYIRRRRAV